MTLQLSYLYAKKSYIAYFKKRHDLAKISFYSLQISETKKTIILSIEILKDTYVYCVIGYIKCCMNKNSNQDTMVLLQIN